MRCPECSQRNSVASKKCTGCGKVLPKKPLPLFGKILLGSVVGLAFGLCLATLSTAIDSPEKALKRAAGEITGQSKSAEQALDNFSRFDQAVQVLLKKFGNLSTVELRQKLAESLPKSLYEAHVFELLPDVKLVEIDTALNVADYIVLLHDEKATIAPVIGLRVYDGSSFLPQTSCKQESGTKLNNSGQMLVLLGHTSGSSGNHPTVKVLFLNANRQAESITDLTDTIVPAIYGEGTAKLAANQKDIDLAVSLLSRGQDMKLFALEQNKPLPLENETLYDQLIWANNHYNLRSQAGASKLYAIYGALAALENHHRLWRQQAYLTNNVRRFIERSPIVFSTTGFVIQGNKLAKNKDASATASNVYTLSDGSKKITAVLRYIPGSKKTTEPGGKWLVEGLAVSAETKPAKSILSKTIPEEKPVVESQTKTMPPTAIPVPEQAAISSKSPTIVGTNATENNDKIIPCHLQATFFPDIKASIKIRSGPGTSYQILNQLKPDTAITVTGRNGSWYRVEAGGKEGYIYGGLINMHGSIAAGCRSAKVLTGFVLRDEKDHVFAYAHKGEHLVIVGSTDKKYKVMLVNGKTGYLDKQAIDAPIPAASTVPHPAISQSETRLVPAPTKPSTPPTRLVPAASPPANLTPTLLPINQAIPPSVKRQRVRVHKKHVETPPTLMP